MLASAGHGWQRHMMRSSALLVGRIGSSGGERAALTRSEAQV